MPNKREVAYNATHGRCAYCGCIVNPMHFFLNQAKPGQQVAACPDCARFKGSDDLDAAGTMDEINYYEGQIYGVLVGLSIMGYITPEEADELQNSVEEDAVI